MKTAARKTRAVKKLQALPEVVALCSITEENFMGKSVWEHAAQGDEGRILDWSPEGNANVFWLRTGTTTIVFPYEVSLRSLVA